MAAPEIDSDSWLLTVEAQRVIGVARQISDPLKAATSLRKEFPSLDSELIRSAQSQARLQLVLERRWNIDASQFLLTEPGIEQATRPSVARFRARSITDQFGTGLRIIDLTCGLGFDALALAQEGHNVSAYEIDPRTAMYARHNLHDTNATISTSDVTTITLPDSDLIFVDPARRKNSEARKIDGSSIRIFDSSQWSPSWEFVNKVAQSTQVIAKVAPGVSDDTLDGWDAQWISDDGDLVEATLTSRGSGLRTATIIDDSGHHTYIGGTKTPSQDVGRWLITPDLALVRAQALDVIALTADAGLVNEHIAWLTTKNPKGVAAIVSSAPKIGSVFEIIQKCAFNEKALKAAIASIPASALTITTRGVTVDVDALRKKLFKNATSGAPELVLAVYRQDNGPIALFTRRITNLSQISV